MNKPIEWTTTDLDMATIKLILGAEIVDGWLSEGREAALAHFACVKSGAWRANERETFAACRSLEALILKGAAK